MSSTRSMGIDKNRPFSNVEQTISSNLNAIEIDFVILKIHVSTRI